MLQSSSYISHGHINISKYFKVKKKLPYFHKKYIVFEPLQIFVVVIFADESNFFVTLSKPNLTDELMNRSYITVVSLLCGQASLFCLLFYKLSTVSISESNIIKMHLIISRRALAREGDYEMMSVCACVR